MCYNGLMRREQMELRNCTGLTVLNPAYQNPEISPRPGASYARLHETIEDGKG